MLTLQDGAVHNIMVMWLPLSIPTPTSVGTGMSSHLNLLNSSYHNYYYFTISAQEHG